MSVQLSFSDRSTVNITESKGAEFQLKDHADKLAQSNRKLEQFTYVVSHDPQALLHTISTQLEVLTKSQETPNDNAQYQTEHISIAVTCLEQLPDVLSSCRARSQAIKLVSIDTQTVIAIVLEKLEDLVQQKPAVIRVQSELSAILANEIQLRQVFQNLISNGIKFCTSQPQFMILATCQGQKCTFCITDKGIGVPRIFQQQGGHIWIESELSQGSKFFFTLKEASNAS